MTHLEIVIVHATGSLQVHGPGPPSDGRVHAVVVSGESGAYAVAAKMAQDIAVNVLSAQAINLTDPLFAALGIQSDSDTAATYFQQVMSELTKIEGDLAKITTKLQSIATGISVIENALTAISSQITDAELQSELTQYAENANVIDQNYQSYAAALAGMASENTFQQATASLYSLFQTTNADAVATAMRNVHDLLVGSGELRGIVSYQGAEVQRALAAWASDPQQLLTLTFPGDTEPSIIGPPVEKNMSLWQDAFPDGSRILSNLSQAASDACDQMIIPALKAAMAVQLKGLSFLCAAWGGTVEESNLTTPVQAIGDVVSAITGLFATIDLDSIASNVIQEHGPRLSAEAMAQQWDAGDPDLTCPFDSDWVHWSAGLEFPDSPGPTYGNQLGAGLAQQPWNYESVAAYAISNAGGFMVENPDGSFTSVDYAANKIGPLTIARPSQLGVAQPTNLTTFIASLPPSPQA